MHIICSKKLFEGRGLKSPCKCPWCNREQEQGIQYKLEKKEADGFEDRNMSGDQNEHRQNTAEKIAEQHHVSYG